MTIRTKDGSGNSNHCFRDDHELYREIIGGRVAAHEKHGKDSIEGVPADSPRWLSILTEEVGEVAHELTYDSTGDLRSELIDVAAVATAWIDALDRAAEAERLREQREAEYRNNLRITTEGGRAWVALTEGGQPFGRLTFPPVGTVEPNWAARAGGFSDPIPDAQPAPEVCPSTLMQEACIRDLGHSRAHRSAAGFFWGGVPEAPEAAFAEGARDQKPDNEPTENDFECCSPKEEARRDAIAAVGEPGRTVGDVHIEAQPTEQEVATKLIYDLFEHATFGITSALDQTLAALRGEQ